VRIVIAGASGFVGGALVRRLRAAGHEVRPLVRRVPAGAGEIFWRPEAGELETSPLDGTDVVINLAGENIAARRWSGSRRERILRSRVEATRTLVVAVGKLARKPRLFLSASAVGFYGDRGDEVLGETSPIGHGFLPEVCLAWETHAEGAARNGIRTVLLRFGMVLGCDGGALARMLPLFRLGLGGPLAGGRQWMSWIAMEDLTGAVLHLLSGGGLSGPINVVAPQPVRNADFTRTLAAILRRPAVLPVPAWALRLAFGRMADEALLSSLRVEPRRLLEAGFKFAHPGLESALRSLLGPGVSTPGQL
jgi:uncharacterized protein (TIGR01777 family)